MTTSTKSTCETAKDRLTPRSQKQGKIGPLELPSELAEVAAAWPELPEHIRAAIRMLVQGYAEETD
jgi:hypothetical protein